MCSVCRQRRVAHHRQSQYLKRCFLTRKGLRPSILTLLPRQTLLLEKLASSCGILTNKASFATAHESSFGLSWRFTAHDAIPAARLPTVTAKSWHATMRLDTNLADASAPCTRWIRALLYRHRNLLVRPVAIFTLLQLACLVTHLAHGLVPGSTLC